MESTSFFALLEVREIFAGLLHVGFVTGEVQTGIRHDTSMGSSRRRGVRRKKKVTAGWNVENNPLISEEMQHVSCPVVGMWSRHHACLSFVFLFVW